jgi:DNA-binding NarL/FixJ family response regulator
VPDLAGGADDAGSGGPCARVVLVEDHAQLRTMYERFISDSGDVEIVASCATARDGIDASVQLAPDVVLVDLSLPDMSGLEVVGHLRERAPSTRVVVVSGADAAVASQQALAAGAVAYVDKIDVARELLPTIRRVVAQ